MFGIGKRKKKKEQQETTEITTVNSSEFDGGSIEIAAGLANAETLGSAVRNAAEKYTKPQQYTGNRNLYDSGVAKRQAKMEVLGNGQKYKDPYTGKELVLTKQEAKLKYGKDWTNHLAEADHNIPLEKIHEQLKDKKFITNKNIKEFANSKDNMTVISRKVNNAKRSKTNEDFFNDDEYLKEKGIKLSKNGKQNALEKSKQSKKSLTKKTNMQTVKNISSTFHSAGLQGAKSSGEMALFMAGVQNIVAVIKGEKNYKDAISDTALIGGKAALMGYVTTGGMTTALHAMTSSSSAFIQGLAQSNVPGKVITAVMVTGETIKKWANSEITTQECILELGEKGVNFFITGKAMLVGQTLIPIPVVGAMVGALVGSMLTGEIYNNLVNTLKTKQLEHDERIRIIEECNKATEQLNLYKSELKVYLENYLNDYRNCFDDALYSIECALASGDADGIISGANQITKKLGGNVYFNSVDEYKTFLDSDEEDYL